MEWITIVALICVIVYQGYFAWQLQQAHERRERELLDRVMCTDYSAFINSQVVREAAKRPDQIYDEQIERGIPV
jgi:hypothetical protein